MKVWLQHGEQQITLGRRQAVLSQPIQRLQLIMCTESHHRPADYELLVLGRSCPARAVQAEDGQLLIAWQIDFEPWWGELILEILYQGEKVWPGGKAGQHIYVDKQLAQRNHQLIRQMEKDLAGRFAVGEIFVKTYDPIQADNMYRRWCLIKTLSILGYHDMAALDGRQPLKIMLDQNRTVSCNVMLDDTDELRSCSVPYQADILVEWRSRAGTLNCLVLLTRYHFLPRMLPYYMGQLHMYRDALVNNQGLRVCRGAFMLTPAAALVPDGLTSLHYQLRYGLGIRPVTPSDDLRLNELELLFKKTMSGGYSGHIRQMRERLETELQQRFPYGCHLTLKGDGFDYQTFGRELRIGEEKTLDDGTVLFKVLAYAPAIDREFGGYVNPDLVDVVANGIRFKHFAAGRFVPGTYVELTDLSEEQQRFLEPWSIYW